jgi:hypothetical protein
MGTRVAAVQLTEGPPLVLLADHLQGDRPILVYRVADLDAALVELAGRVPWGGGNEGVVVNLSDGARVGR